VRAVPLRSNLMPDTPIQIKRYPNRRYYAKHASKYVSLKEIEEMVKDGTNVEIRDSQTGEDLTRTVLTQIIMERQPDKMELFPTDMLHFMVRSNDVMSGFLHDYFHHSLTYLDYLQKHTPTAKNLATPMHWVKAWLDGFTPKGSNDSEKSPSDDVADSSASDLTERIEQLESRIRQLESKEQ
jgi:polyhydroxyalkanoate synthesis repressor PhaR